VAGAALVGGGALAMPGVTAPAPPGLTAARQRAYAALAESVVTGPSMRLEPAATRAAVDAFTQIYAARPADERERADRTLDAVGAVPARAPALNSPQPTGAERAQIVLLEDAMALVAAVVGQPDGGHDSEVI
jgi:hypothetical protein